MKKRLILKTFLIFLPFFTSLLFAGSSFLQTEPVSRERLKIFPVTTDFRSYFFLQSIGTDTSIVIGDFTGGENLITQVYDAKGDNTVDKIYDYYVDSKVFRSPRKSLTQYYTEDMKKFKESIIEGSIFRNNYAYKMKSLAELKYKIKQGGNIKKYGDGFKVTYFDPDAPTSVMSEFYFAKVNDAYDMIFQTNYYYLFNAKISPPLVYSVYCRFSKDPIIAATVEDLIKLVKEVGL